MQIEEMPLPAYPHACAVTGRDDGPVVDFNIEIDGVDPHLYLRLSVVEEAAKLIGMVPKDRVEALEADLRAYGQQIEELREQVGAYQQAQQGLKALEGVTA